MRDPVRSHRRFQLRARVHGPRGAHPRPSCDGRRHRRRFRASGRRAARGNRFRHTMSSKNFGSSPGATSCAARLASETGIRQDRHISVLVSSAAGPGGPRVQEIAAAASRTRTRLTFLLPSSIPPVSPSPCPPVSPSPDPTSSRYSESRRGLLGDQVHDLAPGGADHVEHARPVGRRPGHDESSSASQAACGAIARTAESSPGTRAASARRMTPREARRSRQLRSRKGSREASSDQEQEPVRQAFDVSQLVGREEERAPFAAAPLDEAVEGAEPVGVERGGRLVQEHDRGVRQRRHRESEPLDHSPRVGRDRAGRSTVQGRQAQDFSASGGGHSAKPPVELDDLEAGQGLGERDPLRQVRDRSPAGGPGRVPFGLSDEDRSRGRTHETGGALQRRRLAGAVGAEQRDRLARLDPERQRLHGRVAAVALGETLEANHRRPARRAASPPASPSAEPAIPAASGRAGRFPGRGTRGSSGGRASGE